MEDINIRQIIIAGGGEIPAKGVNVFLWLVIVLLVSIGLIMFWKNRDTQNYKRGTKQIAMADLDNTKFGEWLGGVVSK